MYQASFQSKVIGLSIHMLAVACYASRPIVLGLLKRIIPALKVCKLVTIVSSTSTSNAISKNELHHITKSPPE